MTETIKIVVEGNDEQGGYLSVDDALNQVLDSLDLVGAAMDERDRKDLDWRLVNVTMSSPLAVSVEPICKDRDRSDFSPTVRGATDRTVRILRSLVETQRMPSGMTQAEREIVKKIVKRNTFGVGRTVYHWPGLEEPVRITAPVARKVLEEINTTSNKGGAAFQGIELGSIEGDVVEAITHYGRPAFRVRNRVSEQEIICEIPSARSSEIGRKHSWDEVWAGQRYLVTGVISRKPNGDIAHLLVDDIRSVHVEKVDIGRIADPDFTGGKSPVEYCDEMWGE